MKKNWLNYFSLVTILALIFGGMLTPTQRAQAAGTISLASFGTAYNQDFNTLASSGTSSTVPTGWDFRETGDNANTTYTAGTGSGNTGDTYSFGAASSPERAFGGLLSGNLVPTVGAQFTNNTGGTITSLVISYTGEMWRAGVLNRGAADRLDFQLSTNTTSLGSGTWTDYDSLDFNSPVINTTVGTKDGNSAGFRTAVSSTISGLSIANGATFWIRWTDFNIASSDDGLAVDDFAITPLGVVADSAPYVSSTNPTGGATDVLLTSSIEVSFSEAVNLSGDWFQLVCASSGTHNTTNSVVTGGPITFAIDPNIDFTASETCDLTIFASLVSDQDANDPPDTMTADYTASFTIIGPDNAPAVASTVPADGAINVPLNQNIIINFTEPVNVTDPWFSLNCAASGDHAAAVSGGPTSFTLNPTVDFVYGELCTLTIDATKVADQDNNDPPDNMVVNFVAGFTTLPDPCTLAYTPIYDIQGSGPTVALTGTRTTQGVVVGDYEGPSPALRGFFIQDQGGDGDPATSDGIFVFEGSNANTVGLGDVVRVTGTAGENQGQSQISVGTIIKCGTGSVAPTDVLLPFTAVDEPERFEGMLVRLPQTMVVTEHFQLGRFGQVVLSANGRLKQPTNIVLPGAPALALQAQNNLNRIILDDASQAQNPDPILFARGGQPLSASNTLRGGDTATGVVGVLNYTWAGNAASGNAYRVRPVNALGGFVYFEPVNERPASAPAVGGTVRVVGMNLLNFFNTFADGNASTPGCFPGGADIDCRGANSATEFTRQYQKTIQAILAMNPDVLGVNELENDGYGPSSAIQNLVDLLNGSTAPGTYAFIDVDANTGQVNALGTDAIKVAMLYKPAVVTPVGQTAPLNTAAFVNGGDGSARNRPSLAQAFQVNATGAVFIVDLNHLKSKGSPCDAPDALDGQGNCNQVRVNAVTELLNWFATNPTGTGDPDILMLGDYNSYAMEDPITTVKNGGFTNLIETFLGPDAYSYVFDGQWGYLDHALGSQSILGQVNGVGDYHINADEPSVLDYNVEFKSAGQITSLYAPDQFRVSDHDPVVVGLTPNAPPTVEAGGPYSVGEGSSVTVSATGSDPNGDALTYEWDLDNNGSFETAGQSASFSALGLDGPSSHIVQVRVTDPLGLSAVDTATVDVTNVAPTVNPPMIAPEPSREGELVSVNATFTDPAPDDSPFTCTVDFGDGSGVQAGVVSGNICTGPTHVYSTWGSYPVTVAVTDKDGGTGSITISHTVIFAFSGFFQPVDNLPVVNSVKAGQAVPVKFSLGGDKGLNIFAAGYPKSQVMACNSNDTLDGVEETVTSGNSSLSYAPGNMQYNYVWKTDKVWAGTCRQLVLTFVDGSVQRANFRFTK